VRTAIEALAADRTTTWAPALDATGEITGAEVAETTCRFAKGDLGSSCAVRRRHRVRAQLRDLGGLRFFALVTNIPPIFESGIDIEHHHRLRGGAPEEAIRQLKSDCGMNHASVANFFGNWVWWLGSALGYNVARSVRVFALPEAFATCRGKRLRASFFNVAARVVRSSR